MVACYLFALLQKLCLIYFSIDSRCASFSGLKSLFLVAFLMPIRFRSTDFVVSFSLDLTSFFQDLTSLGQLFMDCLRYCILQSLPCASILRGL